MNTANVPFQTQGKEEETLQRRGDNHKWNMWIGGAYNHELQCYQAANMQLLNVTL
jgi:hypothetical protein